MHKIILFLTVFLFSGIETFATWSIIMIDPKTREIGIAGASCSYNCYGIGKIIPNFGAIIVQAMSNNDARELGAEMIIAESTPEQIIQAMRDVRFDPENQQYAVVTIKYLSEPATYTGDSCHQHFATLTASGISVQGNTLTNENEFKIIMDAVQKGQNDLLNISDILMMALEAGSNAGGDRRCGEQKASSAFITVAKPNDKQPYLDLVIFGQAKGGQNAVELLRKKYDHWKTKKGLAKMAFQWLLLAGLLTVLLSAFLLRVKKFSQTRSRPGVSV
jgi:uncharacterized Ntn-hydrolase superfamily protein